MGLTNDEIDALWVACRQLAWARREPLPSFDAWRQRWRPLIAAHGVEFRFVRMLLDERRRAGDLDEPLVSQVIATARLSHDLDVAWRTAAAAAREAGSDHPVRFQDRRIHAALHAVGGWAAFRRAVFANATAPLEPTFAEAWLAACGQPLEFLPPHAELERAGPDGIARLPTPAHDAAAAKRAGHSSTPEGRPSRPTTAAKPQGDER